MKTIGLTNRLERLEARHRARKGQLQIWPGETEHLELLVWRRNQMMPGTWTEEKKAEFLRRAASLPHLPTPAQPSTKTTDVDELMTALKARLAGVVIDRGRGPIAEPLLSPTQSRAAMVYESVTQGSRVGRRLGPKSDDKLADYRDDQSRECWQND